MSTTAPHRRNPHQIPRHAVQALPPRRRGHRARAATTRPNANPHPRRRTRSPPAGFRWHRAPTSTAHPGPSPKPPPCRRSAPARTAPARTRRPCSSRRVVTFRTSRRGKPRARLARTGPRLPRPTFIRSASSTARRAIGLPPRRGAPACRRQPTDCAARAPIQWSARRCRSGQGRARVSPVRITLIRGRRRTCPPQHAAMTGGTGTRRKARPRTGAMSTTSAAANWCPPGASRRHGAGAKWSISAASR